MSALEAARACVECRIPFFIAAFGVTGFVFGIVGLVMTYRYRQMYDAAMRAHDAAMRALSHWDEHDAPLFVGSFAAPGGWVPPVGWTR